MFQEVCYQCLNARQKENYNYAKIAARLADYGYNCMRLSDDWKGADFIGLHIDGKNDLKVQLKGRLSIYKILRNQNLYIAFIDRNKRSGMYVYPHDDFIQYLKEIESSALQSESWINRGGYSWPNPPEKLAGWLEKYKIMNFEAALESHCDRS